LRRSREYKKGRPWRKKKGPTRRATRERQGTTFPMKESIDRRKKGEDVPKETNGEPKVGFNLKLRGGENGVTLRHGANFLKSSKCQIGRGKRANEGGGDDE